MITRPTSRQIGWLLTGIFWWLVCFWFFTRHNDFPIDYHPDERSKGEQIVSGKLNYHHPLLLLQTSELILRLSGENRTVENAVHAGRLASAAFAALSVVLLAALAGRRAGYLAAIGTAILLPLHPLLYELAHYAKEDPALLMGICLSLLALDVFIERPSCGAALFLGASTGVALSGKYLGVCMVLLCAPVIWQKTRSWKTSGVFAGGFFLAILLINLPSWLHARELWSAIDYEMNAVQLGGAKGLSREVPHAKYLLVFQENTGRAIWMGLAVFIGLSIRRLVKKREWYYTELLLLGLPLVYTLILSFSPKTAERYFLIASPLLITAAWLGWSQFAAEFPGRWKAVVVVATFLPSLIGQWGLTQPMVAGFSHDSRKEMNTWIVLHLPKDGSLVSENRAGLYLPGIQMRKAAFLPDLGTLAELEASGVRYLVVTKTSFGGYLDSKRKPSKDLATQHQQRSDFYRSLFARGKLLQKTGGGDPAILNPEIRLYDLSGVSGSL